MTHLKQTGLSKSYHTFTFHDIHVNKTTYVILWIGYVQASLHWRHLHLISSFLILFRANESIAEFRGSFLLEIWQLQTSQKSWAFCWLNACVRMFKTDVQTNHLTEKVIVQIRQRPQQRHGVFNKSLSVISSAILLCLLPCY